MKRTTEDAGESSKRILVSALIASAILLIAGAVGADLTHIDDTGECTDRDLRVADRQERRGRPSIGDRDQDGISNCTERKVLGTDYRDADSDDDDVDDGDELEDGTDPMDSDTDDDGSDDGEEKEHGTDPHDDDTDDDGESDGDDSDPDGDLDDEIEGDVVSITCPTAEADGSLTLALGQGLDIRLVADTEYDGVESCEDLAALVGGTGSTCQTGGDVHVEVELEEDAADLLAEEVDLEDADCDGSPNHVDEDDDDDGVPDDEDSDDDGDGVPDDEDSDDDEDDDANDE